LKEIAQHVLHVDAHLFDTLWTSKFNHRKILFSYFELNQAIIEFTASKLCSEFVSGSVKLFVLCRSV